MRHRVKFCEDRSNCYGDMTDFRCFKMAAVRHLGFLKVGNFNFRSRTCHGLYYRTSRDKCVRLWGRSYIHTCRSYVHTPRNFTNASLARRMARALTEL